MSGWKESGVSGRHGANGIRKYCRTQTIVVNRFPLKKDVFMMPYTPKTTRMLNRVTELVHKRRRHARRPNRAAGLGLAAAQRASITAFVSTGASRSTQRAARSIREQMRTPRRCGAFSGATGRRYMCESALCVGHRLELPRRPDDRSIHVSL
jgi:hypothetical protein